MRKTKTNNLKLKTFVQILLSRQAPLTNDFSNIRSKEFEKTIVFNNKQKNILFFTERTFC